MEHVVPLLKKEYYVLLGKEGDAEPNIRSDYWGTPSTVALRKPYIGTAAVDCSHTVAVNPNRMVTDRSSDFMQTIGTYILDREIGGRPGRTTRKDSSSKAGEITRCRYK